MAERNGRIARVLLAAFLLAGCADQSKVEEVELSQLLGALPGTYDTNAQADEDAHTGGKASARSHHARDRAGVRPAHRPPCARTCRRWRRMIRTASRVSTCTASRWTTCAASCRPYIPSSSRCAGVTAQSNTAAFSSLAKDDLEKRAGLRGLLAQGAADPSRGRSPTRKRSARRHSFRGSVDAGKCHPPGTSSAPLAMRVTENTLTVGD